MKMTRPYFLAYMCFKHAFVVRKAPSRCMDSSRFHSANGKSTSGWTIWMPALLTRMSTLPYFATVSATPFSTCASSVTFIATAKASLLRDLISAAVACAALRSRSAITGTPPSAASLTAISLPMPLAAPVMMATRPSKRSMIISFFWCVPGGSCLFQIVEDDFAEPERKVGHVVRGGNDLMHRKPRNVTLGVLEQLQRRRPAPRALERYILQVIADQFADARAAIDVRDDLDHETRFCEALQQGLRIELVMLVSHGRRHAEHRAEMQGAHQGFALVRDLRRGKLLGKAPDLASAGDRRIVVEIHGVHVAALLDGPAGSTKPHRNDLTGFRVVAEAGGVRHADELVRDRVTGHFQWFRHHFAQRIDVGTVGDDDKFAIVELVRSPGIGRVVERHGESLGTDIGELHGSVSSLLPKCIELNHAADPRSCCARSKVKTPSAPSGRCNTSGWRSVRTASL